MVVFWWTLAVGWWLHHAGLTPGTHSRRKGREQRGWVAKARGHDGSQWPWVRDRWRNHSFFSWQMCMIAFKLPPWRVLFLVRHDWSKRYWRRERESLEEKNCRFIFKEGGRGRGSLQLVHGGCTVIVVVDAFLYLEKKGDSKQYLPLSRALKSKWLHICKMFRTMPGTQWTPIK